MGSLSNSAKDYGKRPDGTRKASGYLGELALPDGGVATEYSTQSDAVKVNGSRVDFPTLVPTLSQQEVDLMTSDVIPNRKPIPEEIMQKAIRHARSRIDEGKSPFYDPELDGSKKSKQAKRRRQSVLDR